LFQAFNSWRKLHVCYTLWGGSDTLSYNLYSPLL